MGSCGVKRDRRNRHLGRGGRPGKLENLDAEARIRRHGCSDGVGGTIRPRFESKWGSPFAVRGPHSRQRSVNGYRSRTWSWSSGPLS
jgi:hypothetical protein